MTVFEYTALNAKGKKIAGIIDAESFSAGQQKLKTQSIFPISLNRLEQSISSGVQDAAGSIWKKGTVPDFFSSIKSSEVTMITRQLSTLLSAGFPLVKAIATLVPQTDSKAFQRVLSRIKDAIEEGNSFADALLAHPQAFSPVFVNMVSAGESSGTLEIVLERLADFNEKKEDTQKQIKASLAYPVMMAAIGCLVLLFLLTYIVPGITKIFTDMNHSLPMPTQVLLNISAFLKSFWWLVMLMPVLIFLCFHFIRKTDKGALIIDKIIIAIPITGKLTKKMMAARFSRTLGSLLENGVPMLTALKITQSISGNRVISDLVKKAADAVEQGGTLGGVLEKSSAFPNLATQMIKVGEKSGEMKKMLEKSAELFERDVQNAVAAATSIVEPVIILIMGVVIGFIILAICLPIFEINELIH
ncbi:MAG: type II secretion system F family protein [Pseudomonadota bacterium]